MHLNLVELADDRPLPDPQLGGELVRPGCYDLVGVVGSEPLAHHPDEPAMPVVGHGHEPVLPRPPFQVRKLHGPSLVGRLGLRLGPLSAATSCLTRS